MSWEKLEERENQGVKHGGWDLEVLLCDSYRYRFDLAMFKLEAMSESTENMIHSRRQLIDNIIVIFSKWLTSKSALSVKENLNSDISPFL